MIKIFSLKDEIFLAMNNFYNWCLNRQSASLWEKHDSKSGADGSRWQVGAESCNDSTVVTVWSADSSPDSLKIKH